MKSFTVLKASLLLSLVLVAGCGKKTTLSSPEIDYVKTTLDLARNRSSVKKSGIDSIRYQEIVREVYQRHSTSRAAYLKATSDLAATPERADMVYNAIRDSLGVK